MIGTIEILKFAIKDRSLIEWLENRELYEMWESEQKKSRKTAPKKKDTEPKQPATKSKSKKAAGEPKTVKERKQG